jgi:hypothetical protein
VSFLTAIEIGKELGMDIPEEIDILAIEIIEDLVFSENYSSVLEEQIDSIYIQVKCMVEDIISVKLKHSQLLN